MLQLEGTATEPLLSSFAHSFSIQGHLIWTFMVNFFTVLLSGGTSPESYSEVLFTVFRSGGTCPELPPGIFARRDSIRGYCSWAFTEKCCSPCFNPRAPHLNLYREVFLTMLLSSDTSSGPLMGSLVHRVAIQVHLL